jgi:hypothetical protein
MMWVKCLSKQFPDASIVVCEREANKTVPSQLSSLQPTWAAFYGEPMSDGFSEKIVNMLANYYHYLEQLSLSDIHAMRLPMSELVADLDTSINSVLSHCDLPMTPEYRAALNEEVQQASRYRSAHQYSQTELFDWQTLKARFPAQFVHSLSQ